MSFRVELHDVEYGECVVLESGGEVLMVDCGSSNRIIRSGNIDFFDYVRGGIMPRYRGAQRRSFLLTHCHRDHLCGLWRILRMDPVYFDRLFLPVSPYGENGRPLLLEFALYVYVFLSRMTEYSHLNTGVLRLFHRAAGQAGPQRVYPVRAGDTFPFGGTDYDILWPPEDGFPFSEDFAAVVDAQDGLLSSPFLPSAAGEFLRLKRDFCAAYSACCQSSPIRSEDVAETGALLLRIGRLAPFLRLLPCAGQICAAVASPSAQRIYSETLNAASVVFQNRREKGRGRDSFAQDILMTGDAVPETLAAVEPHLYDGYYIVKAPHHGTKSAFSPLLNEISAAHILISNGVSGGRIAEEYAALPGVKHCTGNAACTRFQVDGSCCNRLACCYEMPRPGLAVACPANAGPRAAKTACPCGVHVVSAVGVRPCLCD